MGTERHNHLYLRLPSGYFEIVTFDTPAYVVDINGINSYFIYPLLRRPFYWAIQSVVGTARKLVLQMVQLAIDNIYKLDILVKYAR
jgi:hypothetical protein